MLLLFLSALLVVSEGEQEGCFIDPFTPFELEHQPLFFWQDSNELIYPSENNQGLTLTSGDFISITCAEGILSANEEIPSNFTIAFCDSTSNLRTNAGDILDFNSLKCLHPNLKENGLGSLERTGKSCSDSGELFKIHVSLRKNKLPLVDVCFDSKTKSTLYVHHHVSKNLIFRKNWSMDVVWDDAGVYDLEYSFDEIYGDRSQETINTLLGLPSNSTKYIDNKSLYQLYANVFADSEFFAYEIAQIAVLRTINSVPVWVTVGLTNWVTLIRDVTNYVKKSQVDLQVYSGTLGVTTLPHDETMKEIELFLDVNEEGEKSVPVPRLLWMVLYNSEEKSAVVFVVVNNPHVLSVKDIICQDISSDFQWLTWDKNHAVYGYPYACRYEDVEDKLVVLPKLTVEKILT